jgi:DNA-binding MarR family transcriptional regulator
MSSESPKERKVGELIDLFRLTGHQDNAFDELAAKALGLSRTDLECVSIIERSGGVTAGRLATESGLTTGAVTGVVDRLERAGYAKRVPDPADRRRVAIEVTPKFYSRAREIWGPMAADWQERLSKRFTTQELETIAEFLELTAELGRENIERLSGSTGRV